MRARRFYIFGAAAVVLAAFAGVNGLLAAADGANGADRAGEEEGMQKAIFSAGCFWHVEHAFRQVKGVVRATSGYCGGHTANPTYEEVCSDSTGHAESVEVVYDPSAVSYEQLLDVFWNEHDPTTPNRQGPDIGSQYRSMIFFFTPEQEQAAKASKEALDKSGTYQRPIVTEIVPAQPFYPAEEYHQRYYEKHGLKGCPI